MNLANINFSSRKTFEKRLAEHSWKRFYIIPRTIHSNIDNSQKVSGSRKIVFVRVSIKYLEELS